MNKNHRLFALFVVVTALLAACNPQSAQVTSPIPGTDTPQPPASSPTPLPTRTPTLPPTVTPSDAPTETPEPAPTSIPAVFFDDSSCPFELPPGMDEGRDVECGYLNVPENRSDPASRTIQIAVAIFRNPSGRPEPDPIIYLEGGPGGSALEFINLSFENRFQPMYAANRDIIIFDQRGVGFSNPALDCPAYIELGVELLDNEIGGKELTPKEMYDLNGEYLLECAQDLAGKVDLSQYNSDSNAADVDDLRVVLGYEQVNLWGISYGTRLALEVMRDFPAGIRSVVIDSVVPPDLDIFEETPLSAGRAFNKLFDGCAADSGCSQAYPDLDKIFFQTVDRLNEVPASFEVIDPLANKTYDTIIDGNNLISLVFQFLYDTDIITLLPQIIYETNAGDYRKIASLVGILVATRESSSDGMNLAVNCFEEYPFSSLQEYQANVAKVPELKGWLELSSVEQTFELCPYWQQSQADPSENEPVASDIPILVMSGEYDPITPPTFGEHAAETLAHSYVYTYPGIGHGSSTVEGCPQDMLLSFIDSPTTVPTDACIALMDQPQFVIPLVQEKVKLEPFTNTQMGIQGVAPEGWEEVNTGVYTRNSTPLDTGVVLAQAGPLSAQELLTAFTAQLKLLKAPEPVGTRQANGLDWTLYSFEVQGLKIDMALAEKDGLGMVILLQSDPTERDALYNEVFIPMVDALQPIP